MHALVALLLTATLALSSSGDVHAQEHSPASPPPMDNARLGALLQKLDPATQGRPGYWKLTVRDRAVVVITDENANRMRILTGVSRAEDVPPDLLYRLMQANFDTALDARYAIAQDVLWSAFLHPLSSLTDELFVSGLAQVVTLVETFGTTFTSGGVTFGGGDSNGLAEELQDRLNAI